MSTQEQEPEPSPLGPEEELPDGTFYTVYWWDNGEAVAAQPTLADAQRYVADDIANIRTLQVPAVAEDYELVWNFVEQGWTDGSLPYTDTGKFFQWLRYNAGTEVITKVMVTGGALLALLRKWDEENGLPPAKEPVFHQPAPLPTPTHGQKVVAGAVGKLTTQTTTAPGLTKAEALAVQKAISAATEDVLRVQALTWDRMLPGMAPGQVPEALSQLDTAAGILEHQVARLQRQVGTTSTGGVSARVTALAATLATVQGEVATLTDQLGLVDPSALDSHVNEIGDQVAKNTSSIAVLDKLVPDLATTAALTALTGEVTTVVEQLDLKHASALDTALNGVEHNVADLSRRVDDDDLCCETNATNLADTVSALGGKGLLSALGSLALKALETVAFMGLLETVAAVLNAPLAAAAMVSDVEQLAGWAEQAANTIAADLGQIGPLGG